MKKALGIIISRVSDPKQAKLGDSHQGQEEIIRPAIARTEQKDNVSIEIVETFPYIGSGQVTQELQPLLKTLSIAKKQHPRLEYAFIKSIDRGTRGGGEMMLLIYDMFHNAGVKLIDAYSMIQDNSFNTLAHTGFSYKWSEKNPARKMIYMEGERAREEVQDILSRLIEPQIRYVRFGYAQGEPPFGLQNITVRTEHGKRKVWAMNEQEAPFVLRIFELTLEGKTDSQIIEEINNMGYKSRIDAVYDSQDKKKVIGQTGARPLDQKTLEKIRTNPAHAGIMRHEWIKKNKNDIQRYIRAKQFAGLVTMAVWNKANSGKFTIVDTGTEIRVIEAGKNPKLQKKDNHNSLFPYKNVIRCPIESCTMTLYGSAPRNGSGGTTRTYSHNWQHKYYGINAEKFEAQVHKYLDGIEFEEKFALKLREKILSYWETKRSRIIDDSVTAADRLKENALKQQQLKETIKALRQPKIIAMMEQDMNDLLVEEEDLKQLANKQQKERIDIQSIINKVTYYLEHIGEVIKNERDMQKKEVLFSLLFEEVPTVKDFYFGTAKLACVFKLKDDFAHTMGQDFTSSEPPGI